MVHFFPFSDIVAPSSRQRAYYTAEALRKRGMETIVHTPTVLSMARTPWPRKGLLILELIRALRSVKKKDIIYLQRTVYSKYFFVILVGYVLLFRRKMIFDFDDPVYVHNFFKTKVFSQLADAVIVSTHGQLSWVKQFTHRAHYVHFAIDPEPYEKLSKDYATTSDVPVIGWLGTGPEHLANLPILVPVFTRLAKERDVPFTFVLIGSFNDVRVHSLFDRIPGLKTTFIDRIAYTDPYAAPNEIRKFDIGVIPHQSSGEWNRAKTSMKVMEYMACAVPPVASVFGEMPYLIKDGENGFLAASEEEWVQKLTLLLRDHALRKRLGRAGQQTVKEGGFALDTAVRKIEKIIHSLYETHS